MTLAPPLEGAAPVGAPAALVRALRPRQWLKNLLVLAAPAAAGVLDEPAQAGRSLLALVAFCAASSAGYLVNDVADVAADRHHPAKRLRPVAAGDLPVPMALGAAVVLAAGALVVMALTGQPGAVLCLGVYLATALAYSCGLKRVAVLDLALVAAGFVLRALAGAQAVGVPVSGWFLLVITSGSLFVVTGKRLAEWRDLGGASPTRTALNRYTAGRLRALAVVAVAVCAGAYVLFAWERASTAGGALVLSIVPVLLALGRYLVLLERGHGDAPEDVFLGDRWLQGAALAWVVLFLVGVYPS